MTDSKGGPRVLLVDDDADVLSVLVSLLHRADIQVAEASNGPAALSLARETHFDVLLTDFMMPSMNGAQLAEAAREIQPHLGLIFMSGASHSETVEAAARSLDATILRKPALVSQFVESIRQAWTKIAGHSGS